MSDKLIDDNLNSDNLFVCTSNKNGGFADSYKKMNYCQTYFLYTLFL